MSEAPLSRADEGTGSIRPDGRRRRVYPADVQGRFVRARRWVFFGLVAVYLALPWIQIGGHPAVFLDIPHRQFFLFGATFNAQDVWLLVFLLLGIGLSLFLVTALAGRVWCGWACPQTVFLDGIYRPIERWIEGSREHRARRDTGPWGWAKIWRKGVKHALFGAISLLLAHGFLSYFASLPAVFQMVQRSPATHPEAFVAVMVTAAALYLDFAFFREQLCIGVCPYGRLQAVLIDADSLTVGYDARRGEPRGKAKQAGAGDCVDCFRCVVVCPTGIDIRNGLQLDCIGCTACIDACDEVMVKLGRPRGLVRYDSPNGLEGKPRRVGRPRIYGYAAVLAVGILVAAVALGRREAFEANLLRNAGAPYTLEGDDVRNSFRIHLVNKRPLAATFTIEPEATPGVRFLVPLQTVRLESLADVHAPVVVTYPRGAAGLRRVRIRIHTDGAPDKMVEARLLGPTS